MKKRRPLADLEEMASKDTLDNFDVLIKSKESKDEIKSKQKTKDLITVVDVIKELSLWFFVIGFLVVVLYVCFIIVTNPISSVDDKKWAMTFFASIGSIAIGYLTGKSQKA